MPPSFDPRCAPPLGLVPPVPIDPTGRAGPTRAQARGSRWRKVGPNAYVPAEVGTGSPEQRILEQSTWLPTGGAVTGWAALRLAGAAYFDGRHGTTRLPVPLAVGRRSGCRSHPHVRWSYELLAADDLVTVHEVRATRPVRALFDELRRPGLGRRAVVAADMALAAGVVTLEEMGRFTAAHTAWHRCGLAASALAWAAPGVRSPQETALRLHWVCDAGLPMPRVNQPLFTLDGTFICVADLFDAEAGLVLEYDGADHLDRARQIKDIAREERCRDVGLEYARFTSHDFRDIPALVHRCHAVRSRARFLRPDHREWTLAQPAWWRARRSPTF